MTPMIGSMLEKPGGLRARRAVAGRPAPDLRARPDPSALPPAHHEKGDHAWTSG